ncbi:MAG: glycosyltransferase family 1 protein [Anaerolineales bacterium]|nr:glycosyltransferase family 1 protein [Anaerolineales bacterium]
MTPVPNQLRIAVFTETFLPKIDGIVSILCLMLQLLNELGHKVILFGPPGGPPEYAGAEVVGVGGPRLPFYPELRFNFPRRFVWEKVRAFQPDLVHTVNPFLLGPFGMAYARLLHVPLVASFHTDLARYAEFYGAGFISPILWTYMRALHNRADVNLCPSSTIRNDLRNHGFRRVRWWRRGIDTDFFTPGPRDEAMRARLTGGKPDQFLVINVGRQAPEKRLDLLRDQIFPARDVSLALIGGGPSHEQLKRHFAGTPTILPGYLRGQDLVNAYRSADAFIFPSTTETFGLVALEAMACRLPVIAARTGGVLDTVVHGVNGLYFDPERPAEIRPLVEELRDKPVLREELAENALIHARSRSWRHNGPTRGLLPGRHARLSHFRPRGDNGRNCRRLITVCTLEISLDESNQHRSPCQSRQTRRLSHRLCAPAHCAWPQGCSKHRRRARPTPTGCRLHDQFTRRSLRPNQ